MTAEILDDATRFDVTPVERQDGTLGPPRTLTITLRPCWKKPAVTLRLMLLYELEGVAYYATR